MNTTLKRGLKIISILFICVYFMFILQESKSNKLPQSNNEQWKGTKVEVLTSSTTTTTTTTTRKWHDIKWTTMVTVSEGFHEMFENWWFYYDKLNSPMPVLMLAEDKQTFAKYSDYNNKIQVVLSESGMENYSQAFSYKSKQYKKLVSKRAAYILKEINAGLNVLYTDVDTVWLKDPRSYFIGECDLWAGLDGQNYYCTGFMALKSNTAVKRFLHTWNQALVKMNQLNQPVFNTLIKKSSGLKHCNLPREEFPSGNLYFNTKNKKASESVVVIHNNYLIGHDNKVKRFADWGLWFKSESTNENSTENIIYNQSEKVSYYNTSNDQYLILPHSLTENDLPEGMQMGINQVNAIIAALNEAPNMYSLKEFPEANLLVWGLGNDSPFWHRTTKGQVVFLEDNDNWYNNITHKYPYLKAYKVKYSTKINDSFKRYSTSSQLWNELDIRDQLPESVKNTNWNVVIVDAPLGCCGRGPGRYQSLYTTRLLVKHGHVFVDDCERMVERVMGYLIFERNMMLGENGRTGVQSNKQCHYLVI